MSGREAAAPRRQPAPPRVLLQRPSRLTTSTASPRSSSATRRACASGSTCRCSASGCGSRRRRSPTRPPPTGSPSSCERLVARGRDAERLPVQGVPRAGGQARRLLAALGARTTRREYTLGLARLLAQAAARRRRGGLDLDAAARLARGLGRRRRRTPRCARWPTSPASSRQLAARRPASGSGSRSSPSPAARSRRSRRRATRSRGLAPEWIGVCLDACHLAVQFEDAGRGGRAAARARASRSSRRRSRRALRVRRPVAPRRAASCSRASTSRGSCTRCASA